MNPGRFQYGGPSFQYDPAFPTERIYPANIYVQLSCRNCSVPCFGQFMWTRLLRSQSIPKLSTLLRLASTVLQLREISTNSAIHRGIRKSQIKPKFAHRIREPTKPKPLLNKFQRQYEKLQQRTKESRPRRPNHAGRQDTEDIRESAEQARIYGNRRLERDQRGSRRRPAASPAFLSRNEGVLKGEPRVRSGFLTNIINGQTGRRRDNSYENDRKTLKNRENSYEGVRELDGRDVPGHSEYAHWQHHENVSSSRQGGRRSTESITDTRSEARTSTKRRHEEPVEDSSSRAIAQGKDNRPGGAYFSSRTVECSRNAKPCKARTGDESRLRYQRAADTSRFEGRVPGEAPTPLSIPYTTPASEFLYGTSVVMAALKADHRKFYKLYMYSGENRSIENLDEEVKRLARRRAVEVVKVGSDWVRLLDKMSSGRPHNVSTDSIKLWSHIIDFQRATFSKPLLLPSIQLRAFGGLKGITSPWSFFSNTRPRKTLQSTGGIRSSNTKLLFRDTRFCSC